MLMKLLENSIILNVILFAGFLITAKMSSKVSKFFLLAFLLNLSVGIFILLSLPGARG
jgi:hypothetical protein